MCLCALVQGRKKKNQLVVEGVYFLVQTPAKAFWDFDQDMLISGARRWGVEGEIKYAMHREEK